MRVPTLYVATYLPYHNIVHDNRPIDDNRSGIEAIMVEGLRVVNSDPSKLYHLRGNRLRTDIKCSV